MIRSTSFEGESRLRSALCRAAKDRSRPTSFCCFHFGPSGGFRLRVATLLSPMDQQGMWRWDGLLRWLAEIAGVLSLNVAITYPCVGKVIKS